MLLEILRILETAVHSLHSRHLGEGAKHGYMVYSSGDTITPLSVFRS